MIKLLVLIVVGYFVYRWWSNPNQLPAEPPEEEFTDYEEVD